MSETQQAPTVRTWLTKPMPADVAESIERLAHGADVRHVAVMPDVHLANEICVGVAMATRQRIYPAAVGSDIGCGMAAICFEADAGLLADERAAAQVLARMYRLIPSIKHLPGAVVEELPERLQCSALRGSKGMHRNPQQHPAVERYHKPRS